MNYGHLAGERCNGVAWIYDGLTPLSRDALNTTTPNLADLLVELLPPPIEHRSMEENYTTKISHIAKCTDTLGRLMVCNGVAWMYG